MGFVLGTLASSASYCSVPCQHHLLHFVDHTYMSMCGLKNLEKPCSGRSRGSSPAGLVLSLTLKTMCEIEKQLYNVYNSLSCTVKQSNSDKWFFKFLFHHKPLPRNTQGTPSQRVAAISKLITTFRVREKPKHHWGFQASRSTSWKSVIFMLLPCFSLMSLGHK